MTDKKSDTLKNSNPTAKAGLIGGGPLEFSPQKHELQIKNIKSEFVTTKPSLGSIAQEIKGLTQQRDRQLQQSITDNISNNTRSRIGVSNRINVFRLIYIFIAENHEQVQAQESERRVPVPYQGQAHSRRGSHRSKLCFIQAKSFGDQSQGAHGRHR